MHNYPRNSPDAAARLLALMMIADGNVTPSELGALQRLGTEAELGLPPGGLPHALKTLCEDLLYSARAGATGLSCIDEQLLEALIHEVDDPTLQQKVLAAVTAAAAADGHVSDAELHVLLTLARCWRRAWVTAELRAAA